MEQYTEVKPLFYNKEKLIKQPEIIYRTNLGQKRYYYSIDKIGKVKRCPSVTTIIGSEMKQSEWLIKWIANYGYEQAMIKRDRAGDYGTLFGICASQYFIDRKLDFNSLEARINTYKAAEGISYATPFWNHKLRQDLFALNEFICDYEVEPLAIELMLFSEKGYAGALDIVVEMTIGTGQNGKILKNDRKIDKKTGSIKADRTRRITALIDWKSGRHGFYPSNEAQLHFYKHMWEENYPHLLLDAIFNWSPKDWRTSAPFYNLKEQSDSPEANRIWNYLENFKLSDNSSDKTYQRIEGVLEYGKRKDNLTIETFNERVKRIHVRKDVVGKRESGKEIRKSGELVAEVKELLNKSNGE